MSRLIVFSGLPGSGKSTIARGLATKIGAVWLRIDSLEQAIRDSGLVTGPTMTLATAPAMQWRRTISVLASTLLGTP